MRAAQSLTIPPFQATVAPTPDHVRALEAAVFSAYISPGRIVWIAERETIVRDETRRPSFCHGVMFDVTRLKIAHYRAKRCRSAAEVGR